MSVDVNAVKVSVEGYFTSDDDWHVSRCAGHIEAVKCLINFHSASVTCLASANCSLPDLTQIMCCTCVLKYALCNSI